VKQFVLDHLTQTYQRLGWPIEARFYDARQHDARQHDARQHDARQHDARQHDARQHDADAHYSVDEEALQSPDLLVRLPSGERVALYVINRTLRFSEIKRHFETNTAQNVHTLYLVDGRMMPSDRAQLEPNGWMVALHTLTQGRMYGYWCEARSVSIRPVHLRWHWGRAYRTAEYGPQVDVATCSAQRIELNASPFYGAFASATFGDGPFWKKQTDEEARQFNYSWRQWRQTPPRKERAQAYSQAESQAKWEDWASFNQNFGEDPFYQRYAHQQQANPGAGRTKSASSIHPLQASYTLLGVNDSATPDEIKQAYRRKAREFHPDLHPENRDYFTERMAAINAAFEAISKTWD
jgi:hypothetical protein